MKWLWILALVALSTVPACSQRLTGPSCRWVTQERIERREVTTVEGRLAFITIVIPATRIEVCD